MLDQIATLRALAEAFAFELNLPGARAGASGEILMSMSRAYSRAADSLEQQARDACTGTDRRKG